MTLIEQMTIAKVQEVFKERTMRSLQNYNLNIIGVRSLIK